MIRKKFERAEEKSDAWSPYLHEPYRIRRLRRKQIILAAIAMLLIIAWLLYLFSQMGTNTNIQIFGSTGGSAKASSIPGAVGENSSFSQTPQIVTITVNPGYTVAANFTDPRISTERLQAPPIQQERDKGKIYWINIAIPLLPIAVVLFSAVKIIGFVKSEVNFGIYKGAMPLELHTTKKKLVFNNELQKTNVFGKDRSEYDLEPEPISHSKFL